MKIIFTIDQVRKKYSIVKITCKRFAMTFKRSAFRKFLFLFLNVLHNFAYHITTQRIHSSASYRNKSEDKKSWISIIMRNKINRQKPMIITHPTRLSRRWSYSAGNVICNSLFFIAASRLSPFRTIIDYHFSRRDSSAVAVGWRQGAVCGTAAAESTKKRFSFHLDERGET